MWSPASIAGLLPRSQHASETSCDWPTRLMFSVVFTLVLGQMLIRYPNSAWHFCLSHSSTNVNVRIPPPHNSNKKFPNLYHESSKTQFKVCPYSTFHLTFSSSKSLILTKRIIIWWNSGHGLLNFAAANSNSNLCAPLNVVPNASPILFSLSYLFEFGRSIINWSPLLLTHSTLR